MRVARGGRGKLKTLVFRVLSRRLERSETVSGTSYTGLGEREIAKAGWVDKGRSSPTRGGSGWMWGQGTERGRSS